jgi:membrane fusion protein (multidrug efflux system)
MIQRRRAVLALAAFVLAAGVASAFRSPTAPQAPPSLQAPGVGAAERGRQEKLRAEVYTVAPSTIRDTVRTTGTLAANESVNVVSELSRRLVQVKVIEGTVVEKGALLFKLDDSDLRAELEKLKVQRRLAERSEQRTRRLLENNALSQQTYDQAAAQLRVVQADINVLEVTLAKTEIRAPFGARVGLRRVSEGAWITPTTLLTTLQDTSRMKVDFTVPERHAGAVQIGQPFRFTVAGRGQDFEGQVVAIEPVIDAATRSLLVRGMTENASGLLLPGAFASVEIDVEQASAGILVPALAVAPTPSGQGLFLLRDGKAALQEVEIGMRTADSVEIVRGLSVGDTVITSNLLRLRPGIAVEPIRAEPEAAPAAP